MFSSVSQKRTSEDTTSSSPPKKASAGPKRDARQIYNPPSGKYSSNLGSFSYGELGSLQKLCPVTVVPFGVGGKGKLSTFLEAHIVLSPIFVCNDLFLIADQLVFEYYQPI